MGPGIHNVLGTTSIHSLATATAILAVVVLTFLLQSSIIILQYMVYLSLYTL